jgi:hypothetical protein
LEGGGEELEDGEGVGVGRYEDEVARHLGGGRGLDRGGYG